MKRPFLQESKIYIVFTFHVVKIPQFEQIVLDEVQLEIISRRVRELGDRNGAEALVHRCDYPHWITSQKENFTVLPILSQHLQILYAFTELRNLQIVDITDKKLKVDFPYVFLHLILLLSLFLHNKRIQIGPVVL